MQEHILTNDFRIKYETKLVNAHEGEHKSEAYLKINPNGRLPALSYTKSDGKTYDVWESAACLQFLADQYDTEHRVSFPHGSPEYYQMLSWLAWQVSGLGPSEGQATHFLRYAPELNEYGIKRYVAEARRLFDVMETHLASRSFLVGEKFSIADITCFPWVASCYFGGVTIEDFPNVNAWKARIAARPAVEKAMSSVIGPFFAADENLKSEATREMRRSTAPAIGASIRKASEGWYKRPALYYMEY